MTSQAIWGAPCQKCGGGTVHGVASVREGAVDVCTICGYRHRIIAPASVQAPAPRRPIDATVRPPRRESHKLERRLEVWAREVRRRRGQ